MKCKSFLIIAMLLAQQILAQEPFTNYPVYKGNDLGLTYTASNTQFKIWSPFAEAAELLLYKDGHTGEPFQTTALQQEADGVWTAKLAGNWKGTFYTFRAKRKGAWSNPVADPYAKAVGVNGLRAMVVDLKDTNPIGWLKDKSPVFSARNAATDALIYELHIRDASIDNSAGIQHKGQYLGLIEAGTKNAQGLSTGLDHLKQLGVTHIHLLPFFDYNSVDESKPELAQYNWGYDPLNYNVPEGSYSSNAADGITRIKEVKQMIAGLHQNGLRVIMDVVYNHVADAGKSNFNQLVPGYYFRQNDKGGFSDATACGNETASERPMMRKFMLESLLYWVKEYHIDGFRFDLMGVHDIETMNQISAALYKVKPDILLYGEGWTAGASPLPESMRAVKKNAAQLKGIAVFSDDIRDGIKGSVFEASDRGFASGKAGMEASIKFGIVAGVDHPQVDYTKVNYSKVPYAAAPWNVVTYCECHDNNVLWDKLQLSSPTSTVAERTRMHRLALTIVLTSQGIPFLHAGTEFLRSKKGVENSYNAGDSINAIDWSLKSANKAVVDYIQQLIRLRKAHPAFRLTNAQLIKQCIRFDETAAAGTVVYSIDGVAAKDTWKKILVAHNGNATASLIKLPPGKWYSALEGASKPISGSVRLSGIGSLIVYQR